MLQTKPQTARPKRDARKRLRVAANLTLFFLLSVYIALSPPLMWFVVVGLGSQKCTASECIADFHGHKHEDVWIKASNGARIFGWFFPGKPGGKGVIIHHGQGKNIAYSGFVGSALVFLEAGTSVLLYDYEGYGRSEGLACPEAFKRDAEAAYKFMVDCKHFKPSDIVHCGISLGTGPACAVASQFPCAGVMLLSPYISMRRLARHLFPYLNFYPDSCFPLDLGAQSLAHCKVPVFILHGVHDPIIPVSDSDQIYKSLTGPKTYIRVPDSAHIGGMDCGKAVEESAAVEVCRRFLNSLPGPAVATRV